MGADGGPAHGGAEPAPFQPFALVVSGGPGSSLSTQCWARGPVLRDLFRACRAQGDSREAERGPAADCQLQPQESVAASRCFLQRLRRPALRAAAMRGGDSRLPVPPAGLSRGWCRPRHGHQVADVLFAGQAAPAVTNLSSFLFFFLFLNFMYLLFCVLWAMPLHEQVR